MKALILKEETKDFIKKIVLQLSEDNDIFYVNILDLTQLINAKEWYYEESEKEKYKVYPIEFFNTYLSLLIKQLKLKKNEKIYFEYSHDDYVINFYSTKESKELKKEYNNYFDTINNQLEYFYQ